MFDALSPLRQRPVPAHESLTIPNGSYRDLPIDMTAPGAADELVEASEFGLSGKNYYAHARNPPYWHAAPGAIDGLWLRPRVGARLQSVDARLKPLGLKLFLYDAWRPRAVQAYFHDVWTPAEIARRYPHLDAAAARAEAGKYWAAPTDDPAKPAPHATGAAIDLTLAFEDGAPLWMGSLFDEASDLARTDRFEHGDGAVSFSDEEARANRRLLYWLMTEAGFVNYHREWWHYSWGDQMWAQSTGAAAAFYGLASPPAKG